jgi:hypothetical protein
VTSCVALRSYVNAFSQDRVSIHNEREQAAEPDTIVSGPAYVHMLTTTQTLVPSYPSCGSGPDGSDALLRVHNISFIDIVVSSPTSVTPGKFTCSKAAASCTGFYMRNVTVVGVGSFACQGGVEGSAGLNVKPPACFKPAGEGPPRSCCPFDPHRGALIPWVRVGNVSNVYAVPETPFGAPGKPLLGVSPTEAGCQAMCERDSNCTQYVWDARPSKLKCFGRCDTYWKPHPTPPADNIVSARRVKVKADERDARSLSA